VAKRGDVRIREKEGFKCPWFCEHRSTREPKAVVCTLGTLNTVCGKAFSLLRFFVAVGQRNEVPPRTVANSDKKFSSHKTGANLSSSNPAPTPTTDHQLRAQNPARVRTKITWLIVIKNTAHIKPALTYAAATRCRPCPQDQNPSTGASTLLGAAGIPPHVQLRASLRRRPQPVLRKHLPPRSSVMLSSQERPS
jgi:hypothetical protein